MYWLRLLWWLHLLEYIEAGSRRKCIEVHGFWEAGGNFTKFIECFAGLRHVLFHLVWIGIAKELRPSLYFFFILLSLYCRIHSCTARSLYLFGFVRYFLLLLPSSTLQKRYGVLFSLWAVFSLEILVDHVLSPLFE